MKRIIFIIIYSISMLMMTINTTKFEFSLKKAKNGKYVLQNKTEKKENMKNKKIKKRLVKKERKLLNDEPTEYDPLLKQLSPPSPLIVGATGALGLLGSKLTGYSEKDLRKFVRNSNNRFKFKVDLMKEYSEGFKECEAKLESVNGKWESSLEGFSEQLNDEKNKLGIEFEDENEDLNENILRERGILIRGNSKISS